MKPNRIFAVVVLASSTLIAAPLVDAQSVGQQIGQALGSFFGVQNEAASEDQLRSFNHFLQRNPDTARDIWRRPELVNDRGFVDNHPELRDWMSNYPEAANELRANPDAFMDRERHFQYYEHDFSSGDVKRGELAHFDWFLDSHPEIRHELMRRPELALRDDYLDNHRELRAFLDSHPAVRDYLRNNPSGFMDREERLENRQAVDQDYGHRNYEDQGYRHD